MIHEVIVTTISNEGIVHIAPMGIRFIDKQVVISPFKPSTTLNNITENNIATINFIDDVRVFAGIVSRHKKDWELSARTDLEIVPNLTLTNTFYNVVVNEYQEDDKRPNIICDIKNSEVIKPFLGFNRAQFSVIEAAVLLSRLGMISMDKIDREIEYLKIGIDKTAGPHELEAWGWIQDKILSYKKDSKISND
jgi:hypothetical protein|tara:strand:+ start:174 stop:752 length:579 start_codon:yes stop_codon:yes gene_type:complete